MKKEIKYGVLLCIIVYTLIIILITIILTRNKNIKPIVVKKPVIDSCTIDWANTKNPQKKLYLEYLYNQTK